MKSNIIYTCDYCNSQHKSFTEACECEAKCLGLTIDEYKEYLDLLEEERRAFALYFCTDAGRRKSEWSY